jgi:hypothetical protein
MTGPSGSRISALAPAEGEDEPPVVLPVDDEPVRYESPSSDGAWPCDGAWPAEKVETLQRWISSGTSA